MGGNVAVVSQSYKIRVILLIIVIFIVVVVVDVVYIARRRKLQLFQTDCAVFRAFDKVNRHNTIQQLERGSMPNVMAALPNIGGTLCSTPQSLADAKYWSAVQ